MARISLSKSSLGKQQRALQTWGRYLPALDLKRQQLMTERANWGHACHGLMGSMWRPPTMGS